jgi:hypothetical protein
VTSVICSARQGARSELNWNLNQASGLSHFLYEERQETKERRQLIDALQDYQDGEFDGLVVGDLAEVPASYRGAVLHINDHGNVSLYRQTRFNLTEIGSCV